METISDDTYFGDNVISNPESADHLNQAIIDDAIYDNNPPNILGISNTEPKIHFDRCITNLLNNNHSKDKPMKISEPKDQFDEGLIDDVCDKDHLSKEIVIEKIEPSDYFDKYRMDAGGDSTAEDRSISKSEQDDCFEYSRMDVILPQEKDEEEEEEEDEDEEEEEEVIKTDPDDCFVITGICSLHNELNLVKEKMCQSMSMEHITYRNTSEGESSKESVDGLRSRTKTSVKNEDSIVNNITKSFKTFPLSLKLESDNSTTFSYKTSSDKAYITTRNVQQLYKCNQCFYKTLNKTTFRTHTFTHTGEKPYACTHCPYKAAQKTHLKAHIMTHTGQHPYICNQCCYKTGNKSHYKTHLLIHSGDKPFNCDQCSYRSSVKSSLKTHKLTHTGDKPFICGQCNYRTTTKSILKSHILAHSGNERYVCNYCTYRTSNKTHFKTHTLRHTGTKPYRCDRCSYTASNKSNLQAHTLTHSDGNLYGCHQCSYNTSNKSHFKKHSLTHTGK